MNLVRNDPPQPSARVELKNAHFVDVLNGRLFSAKTRFFMQNGRLETVSPQIQPDFEIDLQGKFVIPGMFNTHCHLQLIMPALLMNSGDSRLIKKFGPQQIEKNLAECLNRGITHVRDTWAEDLRPDHELKRRIQNGEIPGPRLYRSVLVSQLGGCFAPKRGLKDRLMHAMISQPFVPYENENSGVVVFNPQASPREVRDAVDRAIDERGADFIKLYDQREKKVTYQDGATLMSLDQMAVVADQARRRGKPTTLHHLTVESFRRGVQTGVNSLAHMPYDARLNLSDILAFISAGCILEPTLSLAFDLCWKMTGDPVENHPNLAGLTEFRNQIYPALIEEFWLPEFQTSVRAGLEKANRQKTKIFGLLDLAYVLRYYAEIISTGVENVKQLFENDALLALGNDGGSVAPCTVPMIGFELEMFDFCLNQLSSQSLFGGKGALQSATLNSARALGLEADFGSLEAGKVADLAILDENPLTNFRVLGRPVAALFVDGKLKIDNFGVAIQNVSHL